jgi:hypothetical protein
MKRKLNEKNVPEEVSGSSNKPFWDSSAAFDKLCLDPRLLQAILRQKFTKPTPIQARAIPLAFEGKDILGMHLSLKVFLWNLSLTCAQPGPEQAPEKLPHMSFLFYSRSSH